MILLKLLKKITFYFIGVTVSFFFSFFCQAQSPNFVFSQNQISLFKLDEPLSPQDVIKLLNYDPLEYRSSENSQVFLVDLLQKKIFSQKAEYQDGAWKYCWTVDNQPCEEMFEWISSKPTFSKDLSQIAYSARQGSQHFVIHNDQKSPAYDEVGEIHFPYGENKLYYVGRVGKKAQLFIEGKATATYRKIRDLQFLPQTRQLVFKAQKKTAWVYVINEKESPEFDNMGPIVWNANEDHLAFFGYKYFHYHLVSWPDQKESKILDEGLQRLPEWIIFDEENKLIVTLQRKNRKSFFVANDKASRYHFDLIEDLRIDEEEEKIYFTGVIRRQKEESRVAYRWDPRKDRLIRPGPKTFGSSQNIILRKDPPNDQYPNGSQSIVVNGKISKTYSGRLKITNMIFSPQGNFAYIIKKGRSFSSLMVNGEEVVKYPSIYAASYGAQSEDLVYVAKQKDNKEILVRGDQSSEAFDQIRTFFKDGKAHKYHWSASGQSIAFVAEQEGNFYVVINGQKQGPFDLVGTLVIDDKTKKLGWLAGEGSELKWYTVSFN